MTKIVAVEWQEVVKYVVFRKCMLSHGRERDFVCAASFTPYKSTVR
jgi:hypothetical protein